MSCVLNRSGGALMHRYFFYILTMFANGSCPFLPSAVHVGVGLWHGVCTNVSIPESFGDPRPADIRVSYCSTYNSSQSKINLSVFVQQSLYGIQRTNKQKLSGQHLCATILWERNYHVLTKLKIEIFRFMV